eukprot:TRINITY_DN7094_c0_g1_i1.p1 TRINITY_DN7094_c0_g1~~TRINITY_DN7094_c0_g1_i1.p1  ORF type:complete len:286 (+),score=54.40 TRINITY_DN7094_c0_g1_i1:124-981(+)
MFAVGDEKSACARCDVPGYPEHSHLRDTGFESHFDCKEGFQGRSLSWESNHSASTQVGYHEGYFPALEFVDLKPPPFSFTESLGSPRDELLRTAFESKEQVVKDISPVKGPLREVPKWGFSESKEQVVKDTTPVKEPREVPKWGFQDVREEGNGPKTESTWDDVEVTFADSLEDMQTGTWWKVVDEDGKIVPSVQEEEQPIEDDYDVVDAIEAFASKSPSDALTRQRVSLEEGIRTRKKQAKYLLIGSEKNDTAVEIRSHYFRVANELIAEAEVLAAELAVLINS